jgi:hypothetical protein
LAQYPDTIKSFWDWIKAAWQKALSISDIMRFASDMKGTSIPEAIRNTRKLGTLGMIYFDQAKIP